MIKTRIRFFGTIALTAFCIMTAQAQTSYTGAQLNERVVFQDNHTQGVQILSMQSAAQNNALGVQAQIQNTSANNRHVYYRFRWLDNTGVQIGGNNTWRPVLMTPNQTQTIRDTAPSANAVDFRIEMKVE